MAFGQNRQQTHRVQHPSFEAGVTGRHDGHIRFASIQQVAELAAAGLLQLNFNQGVAALILRKEVCQKVLNHLRRGTDAKKAGLPSL